MMKQNRKTETRYYQTFTDDFVESNNQTFRLPDNYIWIHKNLFYRMICKFLYLVTVLFAFLYCRFGLHVIIKNRSLLKECKKSGCFLYGNHTNPTGDAFIPVDIFALQHVYVVASPANLGIPILGPLLPMLGALPLPDTISGMKKLHEAIHIRVMEKSCVVFYPEAHVWPWYTKIRPFPAASFSFPVETGAMSFCMTTTYQERKPGKRPGITVYLDGPFYPDASLSKKEQKERLRDSIYDCMVNRSRNSTYHYINYEKAEL